MRPRLALLYALLLIGLALALSIELALTASEMTP